MRFVLRIATAAAIAAAALGCKKEPAPPAVPLPDAESAPLPPLGAHSVSGKVQAARPGSDPPIVVLEPQQAFDFPAPADRAVMDQSGHAFVPSLLLVRKGQPVRFKNSEELLHTVHVFDTATGESMFNVAIVPIGYYDYTFERAGFYSVTCDVHADMHADILVTSTPYTTFADQQGRFAFADVPAGAYKLTAYTDSGPIERIVQIGEQATELVVDSK